MEPRTGAERYLWRRLQDPEYAEAYRDAREKIDQVDALVATIEARRKELGLSKAELARRAGLKPEAVRRLLSADAPNPTLSTLLSIACGLDSTLVLVRGGPGPEGAASPGGSSGGA